MRRIILMLTILSSILVIWANFDIFPKINCDCNSEKINTIVSDLSLATIAAAIFYFIDIYLKEVHQLRKVKPTLMAHFKTILGLANSFKHDLERALGEELRLKSKEEHSLSTQLNLIKLLEIYTTNRIVAVTWEGRIFELISDTRAEIDRLTIFSQHLDLDTILLLRKIYDCSFFKTSLSIASASIMIANRPTYLPLGNIDSLGTRTNQLENYFKLIEILASSQKLVLSPKSSE